MLGGPRVVGTKQAIDSGTGYGAVLLRRCRSSPRFVGVLGKPVASQRRGHQRRNKPER